MGLKCVPKSQFLQACQAYARTHPEHDTETLEWVQFLRSTDIYWQGKAGARLGPLNTKGGRSRIN